MTNPSPTPGPTAFQLEVKSIARRARRALPGVGIGGGVIDSLGRRWNPALHPRDAKGRFIETGGVARLGGGRGVGRIVRILPGGRVELRMKDGSRRTEKAVQLTMLSRPNGAKPTKSKSSVAKEDSRRTKDPKRGDGVKKDDLGDRDKDGIPDKVDATPDGEQAAKKKPAGAVGQGPRKSAKAKGKPEPREVGRGFKMVDTEVTTGDGGASIGKRDLYDPAGNHVASVNERANVGPTRWSGKVGDKTITAKNEAGWVLQAQQEYDRQRTTRTFRPTGAPKLGADAPEKRSDADAPTAKERTGTPDAPDAKQPGEPAAKQPAGKVDPADVSVAAGGRVIAQKYGSTEQTFLGTVRKDPDRPGKHYAVAADGTKLNAGKGSIGEARAALTAYQNGETTRPYTRKGERAGAPTKRGETAAPQATPADKGKATREQNARDNEAAASQSFREERAKAAKEAQERAAERQERRPDWLDYDKTTPSGGGLLDLWLDRYTESGERSNRDEIESVGVTRKKKIGKDGYYLTNEDGSKSVRVPEVVYDTHRAPDKGDTRDDKENREEVREARQEAVEQAATEQAAPEAVAPEQAGAEWEPNATDDRAGRAAKLASMTDSQLRAHQDRIDRGEVAHPSAARDAAAESSKRKRAALQAQQQSQKLGGGDGDLDKAQAARRDAEAAAGQDNDSRFGREQEQNGGQEATGDPATTGDADDSGALRDPRAEALDDVPAERGGEDGGPGRPLRVAGPAGDEADRDGAAGGRGESGVGAAGVRDVPGSRRGEAGRAEGRDRDGGEGPDSPAAGGRDRGQAGSGSDAAGLGDDQPAVAPRTRFRPQNQGDLAPKEPEAKLQANLAVLRLLRDLDNEDRDATPSEQSILARWSGWGSLPHVFDEDNAKYAAERAEVKELLGDREYRAARNNTRNAHYTDAAIVEATWDAVRDLGFERGDVLEPGSGSGNFIGFAPDGARMTGVELDPTTAGIAKGLYPDATIYNEGFETSPFREGSFDAVVGNVPFSSVKLRDPEHNPGRKFSMHNHFIVKSLAGLKPGGVMAIITSQWTMDNENTAHRAAMLKHADLIGAIRMPSGTHKDAAGTDVVTDLLIFRKRKEGEEPGDTSWLMARPGTKDDGTPLLGANGKVVPLNDYFAANPDKVLGTMADGGWNGSTVVPNGNTIEQLRDRLGAITTAAKRQDRGFNPDVDADDDRPTRIPPNTELGRIAYAGEGTDDKGRKVAKFTRNEEGREVEHTVPLTQQDELRRVLELRDLTDRLLAAEADPESSDDEVEDLRAALNRQYDAYVKKNGPLNRYEWSKKPNKLGEYTKISPQMGGFKHDPRAAEVFALERSYTPPARGERGQGTAKKADLLNRRQVNPPKGDAKQADSPEDAVTLIVERGDELTWETLADTLGVPESQVKDLMGDAVWVDPVSGNLMSRAQFRGDAVRPRWKAAVAALEADPKNPDLLRAVEELEEVLPPAATADEIPLRLGAAWIPTEAIDAFANHLMRFGRGGTARVKVKKDLRGRFGVTSPTGTGRSAELERVKWGTDRKNFYELLTIVMRQQELTFRVNDKDSEGKDVYNEAATEAARDKAQEIAAAWETFVFENPRVADVVTEAYTDAMRSRVPISYDGGQKREFPGKTPHITLNPHQNDAATRMVNEESVLLDHVVGSGKTFTIAAGIMELRRLGLSRKPVVVVPKSLLGQFTTEWKELYPNAKLLAADGDSVSPSNRRKFAALARNSDWDAVVMTQEAFAAIPVTEKAAEEYLDRRLDEMREALNEALAEDAAGSTAKTKKTVKQIEEALDKEKQRILDELAKRKDDGGITFESIGFDYIAADEAHAYKNLHFYTSAEGVSAPNESGLARDMHMKLDVLRENAGPNARIATLATGTPVSNTLAEMFTFIRLLRPDLLKESGTKSFDSWLATFGVLEGKLEQNHAADGYDSKVRLRGFSDALGDLMRTWRTFTDTKTIEDLPYIVRPGVKGGKRQVHVVPMSEHQAGAKRSFRHRVDNLKRGRKEKGDDIEIAIIGDGRQNAIDPRLMSERGLAESGIDPDEDLGESPKIAAIANRVVDNFHATADDRFESDETPGGVQMIFGDSSTPTGKGPNAYQFLKDALVARGIPEETIAFAQDYDSPDQKRYLTDLVNSGKIRVVMGSTRTLGTGTNMQRRLYAAHHMDGSWKPSDIEQREGRILRQGNLYGEVELNAYATQDTHDVKTWDLTAVKQAGLDQLSKADFNAKAMDLGDDTDPMKDYDSIAGLAGDPLSLERRELEWHLKKQRRSAKRFTENVALSKKRREEHLSRASVHENAATTLRDAHAKVTPTRGDDFNAVLDAMPSTDRDTAATLIGQQMERALENAWGDAPSRFYGAKSIKVGGIDLDFFAWTDPKLKKKRVEVRFRVPGTNYYQEQFLPTSPVILGPDEVKDPKKVLARIEDRVNSLDAAANREDTQAAKARAEAQNASISEEQFGGMQELLDTERQMELLNKLLSTDEDKRSALRAERAEYDRLKAETRARAESERVARTAKVAAARETAEETARKRAAAMAATAEERAKESERLRERIKEARQEQEATREATGGSRGGSSGSRSGSRSGSGGGSRSGSRAPRKPADDTAPDRSGDDMLVESDQVTGDMAEVETDLVALGEDLPERPLGAPESDADAPEAPEADETPRAPRSGGSGGSGSGSRSGGNGGSTPDDPADDADTPGGLSDADLRKLRWAAETQTARYSAFGTPDRYVAEAELRDLVDKHGLDTVRAALREHYDANPDLLTESREVQDERAAKRLEDRIAIQERAAAAVKAKDDVAALAALDELEALDPDAKIGNRSIPAMRRAIRALAGKGDDAAPAAPEAPAAAEQDGEDDYVGSPGPLPVMALGLLKSEPDAMDVEVNRRDDNGALVYPITDDEMNRHVRPGAFDDVEAQIGRDPAGSREDTELVTREAESRREQYDEGSLPITWDRSGDDVLNDQRARQARDEFARAKELEESGDLAGALDAMEDIDGSVVIGKDDGYDVTVEDARDRIRATLAEADRDPSDVPPIDKITEEHEAAYTSGKCDELAAALSERTGWPIAVVEGVTEDGKSTGWVHAGVVAPDGSFYDVHGRTDKADLNELLDHYGMWLQDDEGFDDANLRVLDGTETDVTFDPPAPSDEARAIAARLALDAENRDKPSADPDDTADALKDADVEVREPEAPAAPDRGEDSVPTPDAPEAPAAAEVSPEDEDRARGLDLTRLAPFIEPEELDDDTKWAKVTGPADLKVGDVVASYSRGRVRRGRVTKVGAKNVEFEYTTPGAFNELAKLRAYRRGQKPREDADAYWRELAERRYDNRAGRNEDVTPNNDPAEFLAENPDRQSWVDAYTAELVESERADLEKWQNATDDDLRVWAKRTRKTSPATDFHRSLTESAGPEKPAAPAGAPESTPAAPAADQPAVPRAKDADVTITSAAVRFGDRTVEIEPTDMELADGTRLRVRSFVDAPEYGDGQVMVVGMKLKKDGTPGGQEVKPRVHINTLPESVQRGIRGDEVTSDLSEVETDLVELGEDLPERTAGPEVGVRESGRPEDLDGQTVLTGDGLDEEINEGFMLTEDGTGRPTPKPDAAKPGDDMDSLFGDAEDAPQDQWERFGLPDRQNVYADDPTRFPAAMQAAADRGKGTVSDDDRMALRLVGLGVRNGTPAEQMALGMEDGHADALADLGAMLRRAGMPGKMRGDQGSVVDWIDAVVERQRANRRNNDAPETPQTTETAPKDISPEAVERFAVDTLDPDSSVSDYQSALDDASNARTSVNGDWTNKWDGSESWALSLASSAFNDGGAPMSWEELTDELIYLAPETVQSAMQDLASALRESGKDREVRKGKLLSAWLDEGAWVAAPTPDAPATADAPEGTPDAPEAPRRVTTTPGSLNVLKELEARETQDGGPGTGGPVDLTGLDPNARRAAIADGLLEEVDAPEGRSGYYVRITDKGRAALDYDRWRTQQRRAQGMETPELADPDDGDAPVSESEVLDALEEVMGRPLTDAEKAGLDVTPAAKPKKPAKALKRDEVTFHEQYGDVSRGQLAAYKKHNVPPATHDELVGYYGEDNHEAIREAVTNPANHMDGSSSFSDYKWRQNRPPEDTAEAFEQAQDAATAGDGGRDGGDTDAPAPPAADEPEPQGADDDDMPGTDGLDSTPDPEPIPEPEAASGTTPPFERDPELAWAREAIEGESYAPTEQQADIYEAVLSGRMTLVEAMAGTGKTSTLEGIARRLLIHDPDARALYIAFNKTVQTEAEGRMPNNVESRTGHSLGWAFAGKKLTEKMDRRGMLVRPEAIARHLGITSPITVDGENVKPDRVAQAVMSAVRAYARSGDDEIGTQHLPERFRELPPAATAALVAHADRAWADLNSPDGKIKPTHDDFRKMWALSRPDLSTPSKGGGKKAATIVFLDEAQDTPPVLAKVIADQENVQVVVVGDSDQAIYGFTGAVDFLAKFDADLRLPLDKSWRFGPEVADAGNRFLQVKGSKNRVVGGGNPSTIVRGMTDADAVLVRSNGGMLSAVADELDRGRTVGVTKGTKSELQQFVDTARYLKGEGGAPGSMHPDLEPFLTWDEVVKAAKEDRKLSMLVKLDERFGMDGIESLLDRIIETNDPFEGVVFERYDDQMVLGGKTYELAKAVRLATGGKMIGNKIEGGNSLTRYGFDWDRTKKVWTVNGGDEQQRAALDRVRELLGGSSKKPDVIVSTAHKAKGLEWNRVKIGDDFPSPKTGDDGETQFPEDAELMLDYVAVTRAMKELDLGSLEWVLDHSSENGGGRDRTPAADTTPDATPDDAPEAPERVTLDPADVEADRAEIDGDRSTDADVPDAGTTPDAGTPEPDRVTVDPAEVAADRAELDVDPDGPPVATDEELEGLFGKPAVTAMVDDLLAGDVFEANVVDADGNKDRRRVRYVSPRRKGFIRHLNVLDAETGDPLIAHVSDKQPITLESRDGIDSLPSRKTIEKPKTKWDYEEEAREHNIALLDRLGAELDIRRGGEGAPGLGMDLLAPGTETRYDKKLKRNVRYKQKPLPAKYERMLLNGNPVLAGVLANHISEEGTLALFGMTPDELRQYGRGLGRIRLRGGRTAKDMRWAEREEAGRNGWEGDDDQDRSPVWDDIDRIPDMDDGELVREHDRARDDWRYDTSDGEEYRRRLAEERARRAQRTDDERRQENRDRDRRTHDRLSPEREYDDTGFVDPADDTDAPGQTVLRRDEDAERDRDRNRRERERRRRNRGDRGGDGMDGDGLDGDGIDGPDGPDGPGRRKKGDDGRKDRNRRERSRRRRNRRERDRGGNGGPGVPNGLGLPNNDDDGSDDPRNPRGRKPEDRNPRERGDDDRNPRDTGRPDVPADADMDETLDALGRADDAAPEGTLPRPEDFGPDTDPTDEDDAVDAATDPWGARDLAAAAAVADDDGNIDGGDLGGLRANTYGASEAVVNDRLAAAGLDLDWLDRTFGTQDADDIRRGMPYDANLIADMIDGGELDEEHVKSLWGVDRAGLDAFRDGDLTVPGTRSMRDELEGDPWGDPDSDDFDPWAAMDTEPKPVIPPVDTPDDVVKSRADAADGPDGDDEAGLIPAGHVLPGDRIVGGDGQEWDAEKVTPTDDGVHITGRDTATGEVVEDDFTDGDELPVHRESLGGAVDEDGTDGDTDAPATDTAAPDDDALRGPAVEGEDGSAGAGAASTADAPAGTAPTLDVEAPSPEPTPEPRGVDTRTRDRNGRLNAEDLRVGDVIEAKRTDGERGPVTVQHVKRQGAHDLVTGTDPDGNTVYARLNEWGAKMIEGAPDDGALSAREAPEPGVNPLGDNAGSTLPDDLRVGDVVDGHVTRRAYGSLIGDKRVPARLRITGAPTRNGGFLSFPVERVDNAGNPTGEMTRWDVPTNRPVTVRERAAAAALPEPDATPAAVQGERGAWTDGPDGARIATGDGWVAEITPAGDGYDWSFTMPTGDGDMAILSGQSTSPNGARWDMFRAVQDAVIDGRVPIGVLDEPAFTTSPERDGMPVGRPNEPGPVPDAPELEVPDTSGADLPGPTPEAPATPDAPAPGRAIPVSTRRTNEMPVPDPERRAPAEPPADVNGRRAQWRPVESTVAGDLIRAEGITTNGDRRAAAGYAVSAPVPVAITRDGSRTPEYGWMVATTENPDGTGRRDSIITAADALVAYAPPADGGGDVPGGAQTGNALDVLNDRLPDVVPNGKNGTPLFPGALVKDGNGNEGIVAGATDRDVSVIWESGDVSENVAPSSLTVTDEAASIPTGWGKDGRRVESLRDDTPTEPMKVGSKKAADVSEDDTLLLRGADRSLYAAEVIAATRNGDDMVIDVVDTRSGELATIKVPVGDDMIVAHGGKVPVGDRTAPDVEAEAFTPVAPVGEQVAKGGLLPGHRRTINGLGYDFDPTATPEVTQAAARVRAGRGVTATQATALAAAIRAGGSDPDRVAAADALDALAAKLRGDAPTVPGEGKTEAVFPDQIVAGDRVAVSEGGGKFTVGEVVSRREVAPGLFQVSVLNADGGRDFVAGAGDPVWRLGKGDQPEPKIGPDDKESVGRAAHRAAESQTTEYGRVIGDDAAAALDGTSTIHEARDAVAGRLSHDNLKRLTGRAAQRWYDQLTGTGLVNSADRAAYLAAADERRQEVERAAREAILDTLNDVQPIDGESWEQTRERMGRLVREAAADAAASTRKKLAAPEFSGDAPGDPVQGSLFEATDNAGRAMVDAIPAGPEQLTPEQVHRLMAAAMARRGLPSPSVRERIARDMLARSGVPAEKREGILSKLRSALSRLAKRIGEWLRKAMAAFKSGVASGTAWRRRAGRLAAKLRSMMPGTPEWAELKRIVRGDDDGPETGMPGSVPSGPKMPDPGGFGMRAGAVETITKADLEAGRAPTSTDGLVPDVAEDGGPGADTLAHLDLIDGAGQATAERVRAMVDRALTDIGGIEGVQKALADADAAEAAWRRTGSPEAGQLAQDARAAAEIAARRAATVQGKAFLATMKRRRPMGSTKDAHVSFKGGTIEQRAALRWAEQFVPTDWLAHITDKPIKLEEDDHGWYDPATGRMALADLGETVNGQNGYARSAMHELWHHIEANMPDLRRAEGAYHFRRTSAGEVGSRERTGKNKSVTLAELFPGSGYTRDDRTREDSFANPYAGTEYENGQAWEVLTTAAEELFAGDGWLDDDTRYFMLGLIEKLAVNEKGRRR